MPLRVVRRSATERLRRREADLRREQENKRLRATGTLRTETPTSIISREVYGFATRSFPRGKKFRVRVEGFVDGVDEGELMQVVMPNGQTEMRRVIPYTSDRPIGAMQSRNALSRQWSQEFYYSNVYVTNVSIYGASKVVAKRRVQRFRDGINHCVLEVMENALQERADNYVNKYDRNKMMKLIEKCREYKVQYDEGIPEDEMEIVCKTLKFAVTIYDVLDNELFTFNEKCKSHKLSYCNVRLNHVEKGRLCLTNQPVPVTQEELDATLNAVRDRGEFYVYEGNPKEGKPYCIRTLEGGWRVANPEIDEMNECNAENNLNDYSLNATLQPQLNEYIKEARVVNSANCKIYGGEVVDHLDLKMAYSQFVRFENAKFLGKIHQYGRVEDIEFMRKHIGIYRFYITYVNHEVMKKLGFIAGKSYTLPSVEILMLIDKGWLDIELRSGVWGSAVDITLGDNMTDKRKLYQKWSGRLGMEYDSKVFIFPGNMDEAEQLSAVLGSDVVTYYEHTGYIHVSRPKKSVWTLHHVLAFITAYTRMNILAKMEEVGFENVASVVLDGIYLKKECEGDSVFRRKPIVEHTDSTYWYTPSKRTDSFMKEKKVAGNIFLQGGGGSGKSHWVFKNRCYNKDLLYVVPTRALGIQKNAECGVNWTSIQKLIGVKGADGKTCQNWKEEKGRTPAVVFIDELTMISKEMVEEAITMYPNTLFILAGDMEGKQWFQCRNGDGQSFNELYDVSSWKTVQFEKDWRAKDCEELQKLKRELREVMRQWVGEGGRRDAKLIEDWLRNRVNIVSYADAVKMFSIGDVWIDPLRATSDRLLADGVCSGFRCKHEGKDKDGVFRTKGEILTEESGSLTEKKGSITTHSCQGQTISKGKIFVSVGGSFEYAMIYTAVSRAVKMEQLIFVG